MINYIKIKLYTFVIGKYPKNHSWRWKMKKVIRSSWDKEEENSEIYSSDFRESLMDEDQIDAWEEAFMQGYEEAG